MEYSEHEHSELEQQSVEQLLADITLSPSLSPSVVMEDVSDMVLIFGETAH